MQISLLQIQKSQIRKVAADWLTDPECNDSWTIQAPEVVKNRSLSSGAEQHVGAFIGVSKCLGILIGASLALPLKEIIKLTPAAASS